MFKRYDYNHNDRIGHGELRALLMAAGWRDDGEIIGRLVCLYF